MKNIKLILACLIIIGLAACEQTEKKVIDPEKAQTLLTEAATACDIYLKTQEEATKAAFEAEDIIASKSAGVANESYPQITVDPLNLTDWPKTITIDYGPENILGIDGRYRRGMLVISANSFYNVANSEWVITFSNFYQNDHKVEGTQTLRYNGLNSSDNPVYSSSIEEGKITTPEGKVFYFEQETTREWINGKDTHYVLTRNEEDLCDDEFLVSGTHNGESSDGYMYTMTSTQPLHVNVCCQWIMDGRLAISIPEQDLNCEIDYRSNDETGDMCNNEATFTILGETYPITLN